MSYQDWIRENEPDPQSLEQQRAATKELFLQPKISIVVPVFRPPIDALAEMVTSIQGQTYENWELCIANGSTANDRLDTYLTQLSNEDARIKTARLKLNLGIAGNSNRALELASGEFVAFVDQDDMLAPFALFEVAQSLERNPQLDLIYSDHDYLTADGKTRLYPLFKPDWSPEIMLSANYITHLTVIRRALVREAGGFDTDMDGAQDWDLFFKVVERTHRIAHIPKVLYHWRKSPTSTAMDAAAKPYAKAAQIKAVSRHLNAMGLKGAAAFVEPSGRLRVKWLADPKKVSIIILTRGLAGPLRKCLESILRRTRFPNYEILVINNGPKRPEAFSYFKQLAVNPAIRVMHLDGEFNYSRANNFGAKQAVGDYLVFLNNDTEVKSRDWLDELVMWASWSVIGAIGAKLLRRNGQIQHAGVVVGLGGFAGHVYADAAESFDDIFGSTEWYRDYSALTGACLMVRREVFERLGGFREDFLLNGSDVEFGLRLQEVGLRAVYNPFVRLNHIESATHLGNIPPEDFKTSLIYYRDLLVSGDPYFSRNLSQFHTIPTYKSNHEKSPLDYVTGFPGAMPASKTISAGVTMAQYSVEANNIASWFDATPDQIAASQGVHAAFPGQLDIRSLGWFIPEFSNPYYGGIHTILRFANFLRVEKGIQSHFFLTGSTREAAVGRLIASAFPQLQDAPVTAVMIDDRWSRLPPVDAITATLWSTAYYCLKFNNTKRKFYFVQDYEPLFYPAGSVYGQVEATYRFGFYGLANTPTLKEIYEQQYGGAAEHFLPCVDTDLYHPVPAGGAADSEKHLTVFFYGRPDHPRNGFELGAAALRILKKRLGDRVTILSAGAEWQSADFGLEGIISNLGLLTPQQTAVLYRTCDAGFVMMFTKHPSYLPLELMASGCLVVTNKNRATEWLLKDGENCLLTETTPSCIADTLERGLLNAVERNRIVHSARAIMETRFSSWDQEMEKMYRFMCGPKDNIARS